MADILDVQNGFVALITGAVYPNGSPPSALALPVKIYAGWPNMQDLLTDLAPDPTTKLPPAVHVTVFPKPGGRNTTRYPAQWAEGAANATTYTLTAGSSSITVGGQAPASAYVQNIAAVVNGTAYLAKSTGSETAAQMATALGAAIAAGVSGTTVAGAVITLPSSARLGRLGVYSTATGSKEVRREEKPFLLSIWADTPARRSALAAIFDPILSDTPFMTLADGSMARLTFAGTADIDVDQKQGIWRRDITYTVEFATLRTDTFTQIATVVANVTDADNRTIATVNS